MYQPTRQKYCYYYTAKHVVSQESNTRQSWNTQVRSLTSYRYNRHIRGRAWLNNPGTATKKPYREMISEALAECSTRKGLSSVAVYKYIYTNYDVPKDSFQRYAKKELKRYKPLVICLILPLEEWKKEYSRRKESRTSWLRERRVLPPHQSRQEPKRSQEEEVWRTSTPGTNYQNLPRSLRRSLLRKPPRRKRIAVWKRKTNPQLLLLWKRRKSKPKPKPKPLLRLRQRQNLRQRRPQSPRR